MSKLYGPLRVSIDKFSNVKTLWLFLLILPFFMSLLYQWLDSSNIHFIKFTNRLPEWPEGFLFLIVFLLFPSYVLLGLSRLPRKKKIKWAAFLTLSQIVVIPIVLFLSLHTACMFFNQCL